MSTNTLNENFQKFLKTIYDWPESTIEKNVLIHMLEKLCHQNSELENIYQEVSIPCIDHQSSNHNTDENSLVESIEISTKQPVVQNVLQPLIYINCPPTINEDFNVKKLSNPSSNTLPNNTLVKEGDLTVRKGSTILSPLLKKHGSKTIVYCELSYTYCNNEKIVYLVVYENRKSRKPLHKFIIDLNCTFVGESKRDFQYKHDSGIEKKSSCFEHVTDVPKRPPPRLINSILPENIYVCLYDNYSTTNDSHELEFKCGDLLYIINKDGPNFYIGRQLKLPLNNYEQTPIGLVYKGYIRSAYEKV
ncbi:unnamed protein product [Rotaria sp. Silwood2]|nr:unnamed protein product [Rotaria sp. Silwood2]CAF2526954.1 unnamed protein product [Rotaria sp. Silwood2]CAF2758174.1 unnamed protein product [Rotaria sp. Silwood2]CAF3888461.1 unnamed protein product [Rotaria sp. Silwood2]CAF3942468.1 unnamed protein product [Rotaria sp. Silwood2]